MQVIKIHGAIYIKQKQHAHGAHFETIFKIKVK